MSSTVSSPAGECREDARAVMVEYSRNRHRKVKRAWEEAGINRHRLTASAHLLASFNEIKLQAFPPWVPSGSAGAFMALGGPVPSVDTPVDTAAFIPYRFP
jgi:hypothetical protein